ncbi:MAG: alpha-L-rhamnosidase, partial [Cephaloticoccus sp.]|nr:alpha-L-rhamnosidase [Cephaloticoccus sp.]
NRAYVGEDGVIRGDTQCCYVLALANNLVEGEAQQHAIDRLVADIEQRGWHLSTGFIGTKDLMLVLSKIGRTDVAFKLLHQESFPGWLFSINNGATSIWERWDGWTPERGFQDVGMNSFAHYSFGAVYGWMVEDLGGIRPLQPSYEAIVVRPRFDPQLDHCRVRYDSIRGAIETEWRRKEDEIELRCVVPANVHAVVQLEGVPFAKVAVD